MESGTRLGTLFAALYISAISGSVFNSNLKVNSGEGFQVNSILQTTYPVDSSLIETEQFYIYNQNTATKVASSFGNLRSEQNISYNLNDYSSVDPLSVKVVSIDDGANITAHLIHETITNTKPNLKVLVHSDRTLDRARCVRVFAKRRETEVVSESCLLWKDTIDSGDGAATCVVDVALPYDWWSSRDIDVYFDIQESELCTTPSNSIRRYDFPNELYYIGEAVLMFDDRHGAREITEDANIGFSIPAVPQEQGGQFTIIVKLHPGSKLRLFLLRVQCGEGLILRSVNSADNDRWDVRLDRSGSVSGAIDVEASAKSGDFSSPKGQEVIECHFEVVKSAVKLQADIKWSIGYHLQPTEQESIPEGEFHQQDVITSIPISKSDQIASLIAVLKTHEMVSLRRFTNSVATIPVWIYSVDKSGRIAKANGKTTCMSLRPSILEVSKLCDMIYLSGEGSDPGIVDVLFEYADVRRNVNVRVWYPDVKMSIKLTDDRLSEIKGWKIRAETNEVDLNNDVDCNLQYQVSDIQVFTKFYTVHERKDVYMRGGKVQVYADITQHVRHLIQTSDRNVVRFEDGLLRGVAPGKAVVKVVSSQGATLATADIRVATSKTDVDRISANFVSDINMVVSRSQQPGLLTATYSYDKKLSDKLPEGVLELWVHFRDEKVVPLSSFGKHSYKLEIENETPTILALPSTDYNTRYVRVRAVGSGRGALKLTLHMDGDCQKKQSRFLAVSYVYIDSEVSKPAGLFVNDAAYKSETNGRQFYPQQNSEPSLFKPLIHVSSSSKENYQKPVINKPEPVMMDNVDQSGGGGGLTPLETGMFVLMGFLGIVASVFITNCLVYMYRQQKRRDLNGAVGEQGTEKVASGWVWLNKDTLEENAINTTPEQFLSERDFQKRCSRSDSLQSTRSKRSSTGTYKGSECSVRITVNPRNTFNLPDLSDSDEDDELYNAGTPHQPIIGIEEPELSDLSDGLSHGSSSLQSRRSKGSLRRQSAEGSDCDESCMESFIIHEDIDEEEEEIDTDAVPRPESLTQEQFDNLRESVA